MIFKIFNDNYDIWFGRFGNNIISIIKGILVAKKEKGLLQIPKHYILKTFDIDFRENKDCNEEKIFIHNFFQDNEYTLELNISIEDIQYCIDEFIINMINKDMIINDFPEDVLILHIRSGDIFFNEFFQKEKIQPPISFYEKIIDNTNYKKYLILSESYHNPTINNLKNKYPDKIILNNIENTIIGINNSFIYDLSILLSCKNILLTPSTLSVSILLLSHKLKKNIYFFNTIDKNNQTHYLSNKMFEPVDKVLFYYDNIFVHYYNNLDYYKKISSSQTMIENIINYKLY